MAYTVIQDVEINECANVVNVLMLSLIHIFRLLEDYRAQKSAGIKDPVFTKNRLKEVEKDIECW